MASAASTSIRGDANSISGDGSFRYQGGTTSFGFSIGSGETAKEIVAMTKDTDEKRIAADEKRIAAERKTKLKRIAAEMERIAAEKERNELAAGIAFGALCVFGGIAYLKARRDMKLLESNLVNGKRFVEAVSPAATKTAAAAVLFTATGPHPRFHDPPRDRAGPGPVSKATAVTAQQQPELK